MSSPAPSVADRHELDPVEYRKPGRPRDARADRAILEATLELLGETGLAGLTVDAVAARAGVGKATIYRRWSSKEALVLNAWKECIDVTPVPDTGTLRGDLEQLVRTLTAGLAGQTINRVFPQMVAAARVNQELSDEFAHFIAERRRPVREVLRRARERGELPADANLELVHDLLLGPLMYRILVTGAPVTPRVVHDLLELGLRAVTTTAPTASAH